MDFEVLGELTKVETIAAGSGIREISRLRKRYGRGRWRKRKGCAEVLSMTNFLDGHSALGDHVS
jgi:hypothetical protein